MALTLQKNWCRNYLCGTGNSHLIYIFSKGYWEQFDSYDPGQDNPPEPELTNCFVPGYEGY